MVIQLINIVTVVKITRKKFLQIIYILVDPPPPNFDLCQEGGGVPPITPKIVTTLPIDEIFDLLLVLTISDML